MLCQPSHNPTSTFTQASTWLCCHGSRAANIFKHLMNQLPRNSTAFKVPVAPHLLRNSVRFLWIYNPVRIFFASKISLHSQQQDWKLSSNCEDAFHFLCPLYLCQLICLKRREPLRGVGEGRPTTRWTLMSERREDIS